MLKTAFAIWSTGLTTLLAVTLAVAGGAWSVSRVLDNPQETAALKVGAWTAFPDIGSPNADPYAKARTSREGILALGSAEGVAFSASADSAGAALRAECSYRIEGAVPASRFWTLVAAVDQPSTKNPIRLPALNSLSLLRRSDNNFAVTVSTRPAPGNWLEIAGAGPISLLLTVYDSNITAGSALAEITMPTIRRLACDA